MRTGWRRTPPLCDSTFLKCFHFSSTVPESNDPFLRNRSGVAGAARGPSLLVLPHERTRAAFPLPSGTPLFPVYLPSEVAQNTTAFVPAPLTASIGSGAPDDVDFRGRSYGLAALVAARH